MWHAKFFCDFCYFLRLNHVFFLFFFELFYYNNFLFRVGQSKYEKVTE
jgi:hypothetical protein